MDVNNLLGKLAMPSMVHGQLIRIKDYGGYMSQCNGQLTDAQNNNVFDSTSSTTTLSTNNTAKLYAYYGSGTNGNY